MRGHEPAFVIVYAVLAVSLVAESLSLRRAVRQLSGNTRRARRGLLRQIRLENDPTVKTVFAEDASAVTGVLLALAGVCLHQLTGDPRWEGLAALAIAGLLAFVAYRLGRNTKELLIGEAADPELRLAAFELLRAQPEIDTVLALLTMQLSPDTVLLVASADLSDGLDSDRVEAISGRIKNEVQARLPEITQVFLDIGDASDPDRHLSGQRLAALQDLVRQRAR